MENRPQIEMPDPPKGIEKRAEDTKHEMTSDTAGDPIYVPYQDIDPFVATPEEEAAAAKFAAEYGDRLMARIASGEEIDSKLRAERQAYLDQDIPEMTVIGLMDLGVSDERAFEIAAKNQRDRRALESARQNARWQRPDQSQEKAAK